MQEQATKLRDDTSGTALPEPPHAPMTPTASPGWEKPARYLTAIFLILGVIVAFGLFLPVLQIVLLAFIFAIVVDIPARFLARYTPLSYRVGTALVYLLIVAVVVLLVVLLAPHLIAGFEQVRAAIEARRASGADPIVSLSDFSQVVIRALIAAVRGLVTSISIVGTALLLGFMLQLDLFNARGALAALVPLRHGRDLSIVLATLDTIWSRYLAVQVIFGAVLGLATYLQNLAMGVPFPAILGVMSGMLSLIPSVGGLVSNVVVFVPCLLLGSTRLTGMSNLSFALWVAIVNLLINQAAYYLIGLPLTRRAVQLPISLVTAAVLLGLAANNIPLAFLVVPIIATLRVIGGYLLAKAAGRDPFQGAAPDTGAYPGFFSQLYTPPPVDAPAPEQRVA